MRREREREIAGEDRGGEDQRREEGKRERQVDSRDKAGDRRCKVNSRENEEWVTEVEDQPTYNSRLQFKAIGPDFHAELIPVQSPSMRESYLASFPPLTSMLNFGVFAHLTSRLRPPDIITTVILMITTNVII